MVFIDHELDVSGQAGRVEPHDEAAPVSAVDDAGAVPDPEPVGREVRLVRQEPNGLEDLEDEPGAVEAADRVVTAPDVGQPEEGPGILHRLGAEVGSLHVVGGHAGRDSGRRGAGDLLVEVEIARRLAEDGAGISEVDQPVPRDHRIDEQEIDGGRGEADEGGEKEGPHAFRKVLHLALDDLGDERDDSAGEDGDDRVDGGHVDLEPEHRDGRRLLGQGGQGREQKEGGRDERDGQDAGEFFHGDLLTDCGHVAMMIRGTFWPKPGNLSPGDGKPVFGSQESWGNCRIDTIIKGGKCCEKAT